MPRIDERRVTDGHFRLSTARCGWLAWAALALLAVTFSAARAAPESPAPVMTGRYHFLGPEDELAILQEETMLKGFIDVFQGESASDVLFSYPIVEGSRHGNHVQFTTRAIHEKYYRFDGTVERGKGKKAGDADYLQLVGVLETVTRDSTTGQNQATRQNVVFKSMSRGEGDE